MRTPIAYRIAIATAVWMLSAGVLFAADEIAPKTDPIPARDESGIDAVDQNDPDAYYRYPGYILPSIFPGAPVIDIIIRWDPRPPLGDIFYQGGTRNDVIEPGDPCREGGSGALMMCVE